jgi:hypothetical protein
MRLAALGEPPFVQSEHLNSDNRQLKGLQLTRQLRGHWQLGRATPSGRLMALSFRQFSVRHSARRPLRPAGRTVRPTTAPAPPQPTRGPLGRPPGCQWHPALSRQPGRLGP